MTLMNETIQDRIGQRRLTEIRVPGIHGELARDQRRTGIDAVIKDFKQISPILRRERRQTPVIDLCVAQRKSIHVANAVMLTFAFRPQRHRQNKLSYST